MKKTNGTLLPYFSLSGIEAGLDEAGRGCLSGPVVAAAVILPFNYHNELLKNETNSNARDYLKDHTEMSQMLEGKIREKLMSSDHDDSESSD